MPEAGTRLAVAVLVVLVATARAPAADLPESWRVASIQMPISAHLDKNLERILDGIERASEAGARVAVFPETALSGFDAGTIDSLDRTRLAAAEAQIAEAARDGGIHVIYGTATPRERGKPFNSAVVVGTGGEEVTRYHKMVPEGWFEPGDHLALFEVDGVPCTLIICHDERYPELVRLPVLSGARVCFYISYEVNDLESALRKREGYRAQLIARAAENNIWVVQANGIGPLPDDPGRMSLGHSRIVDPGGVVVREAPGLAEALLVEDIHPARATRRNALASQRIRLLGSWWHSGIARVASEEAPTAPESTAPESTKLRLGLLKAVPAKWDVEGNFRVFLELLETAGARGAEVVVTPEGWLDGYASPADDSTPEKLRSVAQDLDSSPYLQRVAREARERAMYICFGFTSIEGDAIYNAAGLWGPDGERIGVYHKTHLQGHDLQYSAGVALPVWPTPWGPTGVMICADRRWPETTRTLRLKGAKLILNPTYGMHHLANEWWMRTRGYENQCFIAFAHPKVAFVVGPRGEIEGKLEDEGPGVLICDVDLARATDDNHIRDRRPELYRIISAER